MNDFATSREAGNLVLTAVVCFGAAFVGALLVLCEVANRRRARRAQTLRDARSRRRQSVVASPIRQTRDEKRPVAQRLRAHLEKAERPALIEDFAQWAERSR